MKSIHTRNSFKMKSALSIFSLFIIFSCASTKSTNDASEPPVIKKITEAFYVKSEKNINREFALKNRITKISFYIQKGSIIEEQQFRSDSDTSYISRKTITSRNQNDEPLKGYIYGEDNQLKEYWIPLLDEKSNVVEYRTYNTNDELIKIQNISYDESGNEIENVQCDANGYVKFWIESKYNSENQIIEHQNYSSAGILYRYFSYDERGNRIKHTVVTPDRGTTIINYEYDENDNIIVVKAFDSEGNLKNESRYEYVFDKYGNCITTKNIHSTETEFIYQRSIEYYE